MREPPAPPKPRVRPPGHGGDICGERAPDRGSHRGFARGYPPPFAAGATARGRVGRRVSSRRPGVRAILRGPGGTRPRPARTRLTGALLGVRRPPPPSARSWHHEAAGYRQRSAGRPPGLRRRGAWCGWTSRTDACGPPGGLPGRTPPSPGQPAGQWASGIPGVLGGRVALEVVRRITPGTGLKRPLRGAPGRLPSARPLRTPLRTPSYPLLPSVTLRGVTPRYGAKLT